MFSVIIPAYNCEATIEQVLKSVVNQTRKDLIDEVIIINDGSPDNCEAVIKDFLEKDDSGLDFKYIHQRNMGVSATRNKGIRMAKGQWIALLDSDDVWLPQKLEKQYDAIKSNDKIVFLGTDFPLFKGFKKASGHLEKLSPMELCIRYTPTTPSVVFKRSVGIELGLFDESRSFCEDIGFFQKFMLHDSYYILNEKLVEIDIGKAVFGEKGLSSNLYRMHKGRDRNTVEMHRLKLINGFEMVCMLAFNQVKFIRRFLKTKLFMK